MSRIHLVGATALVLASSAFAQLPVPPVNLPRGASVADNFSPTTVTNFHQRVASPAQRLPARTCVGVTGLARDALVEIDLVARRPKP